MPRRTRSRGASSSRPSLPRRKLVWARAHLFANVLPSVVDLLQDFRTELDWTGTPGVTMMRLRADLLVTNAGATAPSDASVLFGVIRWNIGSLGSIATPFTDAGADWAAYGRMYVGAQGALSSQFTIDVRSMRKLEELQQTMALVFEAPTAETGTSITGTVSTLLALP
jgi:hypothetical protein